MALASGELHDGLVSGGRPPLPTAEVPGNGTGFPAPGDRQSLLLRGYTHLLFALKVTHDGLSVAEVVAQSGQPPEAVASALDVAAEIGLVLRPG